jgi:integrase
LIELNQAALEAATRLYQRAEMLGASEPEHYLLPADMSRHTRASDPLLGRIGFDPTQHQETFHTAWRSLRKAAGLDGLRFHDLRHSFISMMAERNVPLAVVQSMVGHISPAITRLYTHISTQAARAAVELLNQPAFVDRFVDENGGQKILAGKLLN